MAAGIRGIDALSAAAPACVACGTTREQQRTETRHVVRDTAIQTKAGRPFGGTHRETRQHPFPLETGQ